MPKISVINSKKLVKFLEKLGFRQDHATGRHFIFYNLKTVSVIRILILKKCLLSFFSPSNLK